MPIFAPLIFPKGFRIARSLRFRAPSSATLSRTFAANPVTRTKCHIHMWMKRGSAWGTQTYFFNSYDGSSGVSAFLAFNTANQLQLDIGGSSAQTLTTLQVFRDPAAWYCLDVAIDTTQGTAANRYSLWINGVAVTTFASVTYPALNALHMFMLGNANNRIGSRWDSGAGTFTDFAIADLYFIDGSVATASTFGQFDANNNWVPIPPTGLTYGANGFHLDFSDNSSTTNLCLDRSGNANNWTPNNISVTVGPTYDSVVDSPTPYGGDSGLGGEARCSYCVLNGANKGASATIGGMLDLTNTSSGTLLFGSMSVSSGQWYWEYTLTSANSLQGIALDTTPPGTLYCGNTAGSYGYGAGGTKWNNSASSAYGATCTTNDVVGVALDLNAMTLTFYKNGVSQGVAFSSLPAGAYVPCGGNNTAQTGSFNFGQRPFAYPAPTGFKTLCTQNLIAPSIQKPSLHFNQSNSTGNGAARSVTGVGHRPDLLYMKVRSQAYSNRMTDSVRGVNAMLMTDTANIETSAASHVNDWVSSFDADGFSFGGATSSSNGTNGSGDTEFVLSWKGGGSAIPNNVGSITSQVSANPTAGFSVVTWALAASNQTVGHGLGVAPKLIIVRDRTATFSWFVWHALLTATQYLVFNSNAVISTSATVWGGVLPNANTFGQGVAAGSAAGDNMVAYCFAEVPGYSKIGNYSGNGSAEGPFIYCGFRPKMVLIKRTDVANDWTWVNTSGIVGNPVITYLMPDLLNVESATILCDYLSNGFKLRDTGLWANASGGSYIYFAIAEMPYNYSRAR